MAKNKIDGENRIAVPIISPLQPYGSTTKYARALVRDAPIPQAKQEKEIRNPRTFIVDISAEMMYGQDHLYKDKVLDKL